MDVGHDDLGMPLPPIEFSYAIKSAGCSDSEHGSPTLAAVNPIFDDDLDDLDMMLPLPPQHNLACYPYNTFLGSPQRSVEAPSSPPIFKSCASLPHKDTLAITQGVGAFWSSLSEAMQSCSMQDEVACTQPRPKVTLVKAVPGGRTGGPPSDSASVSQPNTPEPKIGAFQPRRQHLTLPASDADSGRISGPSTLPNSSTSVHSSFSTLTCPEEGSCITDDPDLSPEPTSASKPLYSLTHPHLLQCKVEPGQKLLYLGSLRMMDTSHVKFPIVTSTDQPGWITEKTKVWRRFSDFLSLHDALATSYPNLYLPVRPKKFRPAGARFLEARQAELQRYLSRLIAYPDVRTSSLMRVFLQEPDFMWVGSWEVLKRSSSLARSAALCTSSRSQLRSRLARVEAETGTEVSGLEKELRQAADEQAHVRSELDHLNAAAQQVVVQLKAAAHAATHFADSLKDLAKYELDSKLTTCRSTGCSELAISKTLGVVAGLEDDAADKLTHNFEALDEEQQILSNAQEALSGREVLLMKSLQLSHQLSASDQGVPRAWSFHLRTTTTTMEAQLGSMLAEYEQLAQQQGQMFGPIMSGLHSSLMTVMQDFAATQEFLSLELNLAWTEAAACL